MKPSVQFSVSHCAEGQQCACPTRGRKRRTGLSIRESCERRAPYLQHLQRHISSFYGSLASSAPPPAGGPRSARLPSNTRTRCSLSTSRADDPLMATRKTQRPAATAQHRTALLCEEPSTRALKPPRFIVPRILTLTRPQHRQAELLQGNKKPSAAR